MTESRPLAYPAPAEETPGPSRPVRARRALAAAAMLAALAIGLPRFLTHTPYPRFGVVLDWSAHGDRLAIAEVVGPPGKGVFQKGDRLLAYQGRPLTREVVREHSRKQDWPRDAFTLEIERGGRSLQVVVPPLRLTAWQRVRIYTLPLAAVVAVPIVAFLLVWRRPDLPTAWVFLWFATLQGLSAIYDLFRNPATDVSRGFRLYLDSYHAVTFLYPAAFLHFMTVFPRPRWSGRWAWTSVWFWLVALTYAAGPALIPLAHALGRPPDKMFLWFETGVFTLGIVSLLDRYARPARPGWSPRWSERTLALVVGASMLVATLFTVFEALIEDPRVIALLTLPVMRLVLTVATLAWLSSPLLIAFLIANDPAFDPRRLVVKGLPYFLLSGVLAGVYLLTVLASQRVFAAATGEDAMVFNVIAALIVAFAFAPLRERLQRWLDRLFGRDPRALRRALDQSGRELLGALDRAQVQASVEGGLARGLRRSVALEWPAEGPPQLADPGEIPEEALRAVENLLLQAGIRLENLSLQEQRAAGDRRAAELREAATRAELRALHAQVQPHFLFNALNALSYLTETDPAAAQRFTERLADMLRYTVEASERPAALLSEEIAFVEDYLGVARERYENALAFEYVGSRELLSLPVPPLLLQPLVENSLKHGGPPGTEALHLKLAAREDDGWVTLDFEDDGCSTGNGAPGLGVGLQNLEQRVQRFAGEGSRVEARRGARGGFQVTLRWRKERAEAK
ncbi:MAG TPA: histidine kinase [Candidatus Eisenbacteria bacterium]|jgi:hypothetical protein